MKFFIIIFSIFFFSSSLFASGKARGDWADLFEGDKKVIGSEKEEKYSCIMGPFGESENWEGHYSWMALTFMKYTDYPKYSSFYAIPFYYSLNSKIDNREKTWGLIWPGLYYYHIKDGPDELTVHIPFYFSNLKEDERDRSILYLFWWGGESNKSSGNNKSYNALYPLYSYSRSDNEKTGSYDKKFILLYLSYNKWKTYSYNNVKYSNTFTISPLHYYSSDSRSDAKIDDTTFWFPIIPAFFWHSSPARGHVNIAWLIDFSWKRENTESRLNRFWIMPAIFHKSGPNGYFHVAPPVFVSLRSETEELYWHFYPFVLWRNKKINYSYDFAEKKNIYIYSNSFLSILFSRYTERMGEKKWDGEPNKVTMFAPIVPFLFYYHTEPERTHLNLLTLFDMSWKKKGGDESWNRFWIMPFVYHKFGPDGYTHVMPLFMYFREGSGEHYSHFIPLFFSWSGIDSKYNYQKKNHDNIYTSHFVSPVFYRSTKHKGEKKWDEEPYYKTTWAGLLLPLYYQHSDQYGSHKNLLWIFDWSRNEKGVLKRFWFIPFYFENFSEDGYRHIFPVFFSWKSVTSYYDNIKMTPAHDSRAYTVSPVYYRSTRHMGDKKWDGEPYSETRWFGLFLPFYYKHVDLQGMHKNLFWIVDWSRDSNGDLKRFWFMPFWYDRYGPDGYRHILFPLFMSFRDNTGEYYRHFIPPIYISWRSINSVYDVKTSVSSNEYSGSLFTAVYSRFTRHRGEKKWDEEPYETRFWWGPLLPLYYSYSNEKGVHRNLFWIFDWKKDIIGAYERFWAIPLVFWKGGPGGYRHYIPFYMKPSGWTEEKGYSWGLFHYNSWSPEKNVTWAWPYYSKENLKDGTYYTHLIPFYLSWKTKDRFIHYNIIGIPWQFQWEDKKNSVKFNLLGFSKSASLNPLTPGVSLDFGTYKGNWYLDTDLSWLYDMVSVSNRITIKNPFAKKQDIKVSELEEKDSLTGELKVNEKEIEKSKGPTIGKKSDLSRENSNFFFGWKVLLGWMAYERADARRHFRLIPLGWITWDETSDDKLYVFPLPLPTVSYRSEFGDSRYLVVFPLFGWQRVQKSTKLGILLNLFWHEYDDDEKLTEVTVLWPFINRYSSPKRSGWRLFPLIWHSEEKSEGIHTSRYISPIHYSHYKTDESGNAELYKFVLNPLYHSKKSMEGDAVYERTFIPAFLPLYGNLSREISYSYEETNSGGNEKGDALPGSMAGYEMRDRKWFFPFWFKSESMEVNIDGEKTGDFTQIVLPLFYYHSTEYTAVREKNIAVDQGLDTGTGTSAKKEADKKISDAANKKEYTFYSLLFSRNRSEKIIENSFLYGLLKSSYFPAADDSEIQFLWFWRHRSSKDRTRFIMPPFFYYYNSQSKFEISFLMGLIKREAFDLGKKEKIDDETRSYSSWKLLWGLAYGSKSYDWIADDLVKYRPVEVRDSRFWIFPLYYNYEAGGLNKNYSYSKHLTPLFYKKYEEFESDGKTMYLSTFTWFIPFIYRHTTEAGTHWNILGIIDWKRSTDYSRTFALPIFYTSSEKNRSHTNLALFIDWEKKNGEWDNIWVFPLFFRYWGVKNNIFIPLLLSNFRWNEYETTNIILGTYWHTSKEYERRNIWYLYDHRRYNSADSDSYGLLFHAIKYDVNPEITRIRLAWGALLSYANYKNSPNYDHYFLLGLSGWENNSRYFKNYIMPLYYYKSYYDEGNGWYCVSPLFLSYLSKDRNGDFDLGLLGLVYYRNNNISAKEDRRMVLLGTVYNEVKKPERGYHSRGSLWGLLWEYEEESETDFKKLTVLKGLYKRVEYKGEVKNKYFWVF